MNALPFTDPMYVFSTVLAIILFAPMVAIKLRMPDVIGVILAGILVGPSVLNLLTLEGSLTLLGQVGLLYIMFIAGLEINMTDFLRHKDRSIVFGAITFTIPMILGTLLFLYLGFSWLASLLIASMFASHTLVAYPIISRLGITQNRAVTTTVGGTILTDTAALLLLVVIASAYQGQLTSAFWVRMALMFLLYLFLVVKVMPRIARWFFSHVEDAKGDFLFVLFLAFSFSALARAMGIEPIVGAFFVGLSLNRMVPKSSVLMNRIQFVGNSLFIPFFLLYIGLLVDVRVILSGTGAWVVVGGLMLGNIGTKLIASKITEKIYGFTPAEGWVIFGLSTTEAAATLAATLVGYRLGIIGDEVMNGVILLILSTCVLGSVVVERNGRKIAAAKAHPETSPDTASPRVLIPVANPASLEGLMETAMLMNPGPETTLYPMTVVYPGKNLEQRVAESEAWLHNAKDLATANDISAEALVRVDLNVAAGIKRAVQELRIRDMVLGWDRQPTAMDIILGTILDQLLDITREQIMVCHFTQKITLHERLVVALPVNTENESGFPRAMRALLELAGNLSLSVLILLEGEEGEPASRPPRIPDSPVQVQIEALPHSEDLFTEIRRSLGPKDILCLLAARKHTLSWTSEVERFPRKLAEQFERQSFIAIYPEIQGDEMK
ncbi:MAG: cation:proton antiporter [Verrucomicrobia bacterium]|nr:cation:proton antiporter [Verrucomicrobiota bacterium]MCH8514481.1 cation:proton antiporter [Kiritimatiellia bacterium]